MWVLIIVGVVFTVGFFAFIAMLGEAATGD
jgi:hypothetical protein